MEKIKGLNEYGLWKSRYYAVKNRTVSENVTVKVCGGYRNMTWQEWYSWKKQK